MSDASLPTGFQHAVIMRADQTSTKVEVQFNPNKLNITRRFKYVEGPSSGKNVGPKQFAGGEAQDLNLELLFDSTADGSDVRDKYKTLLTMAEIDETKKDPKTFKGEPPQVKFQWGTLLTYTGVITNISQEFQLFKIDGTPLRARVTVTISETGHLQKKQNPTTVTESRKVWVVHEGQTLDWIAFQEYGDSACWRHIAETNDLANPMDLRPGQVLRLVPLA